MKIEVLDNSSFQSTIESSEKTVIVDFYADWCGPCKMIAPVLEEIAVENEDAVSVYKVNVDESPQIAAQFSIMSIPSIISFKNGTMHKKIIGAQPKEALLDLIQ